MPLQINLPSRGALVTKTGLWTGAMWAWMRDITKAITAGGGPAPVDAEYLVGGADPALTNERVVTNTATATWDLTTAGQAAVNVVASAVLDLIGSTRGSILYRGAFGWAILVPGTATYALTSNGTGADPSYQAIPSDSIQVLLDGISTTQGAILYRNAADWVALSPGTAGQFLQTAGAAANPLWASTVTVDYVVAGDGAQPPTAVDNGAGSFVYTPYTP